MSIIPFKFGAILLTALDVLAILKNMALCPLDALFVRASDIVARRAVIRKDIPRADGCNDAETMDDFMDGFPCLHKRSLSKYYKTSFASLRCMLIQNNALQRCSIGIAGSLGMKGQAQ